MNFSTLFVALLLFAAPFWESKPVAEWTTPQAQQLLNDSPWAQKLVTPGKNDMPPVQSFLATATPVRQAEAELERRARARRTPGGSDAEDPSAVEYRIWLEDFSPTQVVLAIRIKDILAYSESKELKHLEEDSFLHVGRRKIPVTGYFPPTAADPYLRVAFARKGIVVADKVLRFELYVPGIAGPFREVEFKLDTMLVNGRLEI